LVLPVPKAGPLLLKLVTLSEASVAPGNKIVSATHDSNDKYRALSGTSMACPHVAGAVAILLSANRGAKFDQILDVLEKNAIKPFSNFWEMVSTCTVPPNKVPSNAFGWGRIDVYAAMKKTSDPHFLIAIYCTFNILALQCTDGYQNKLTSFIMTKKMGLPVNQNVLRVP